MMTASPTKTSLRRKPKKGRRWFFRRQIVMCYRHDLMGCIDSIGTATDGAEAKHRISSDRHSVVLNTRALLPILVGAQLIVPLVMMQARAAITTINSKHFKESFASEVPISGATLVGVSYEEGAGNPGGTLWVHVPAHVLPMLCVTVTTDDGRYSSRVEFDLTGVQHASVALDYPTVFRQQLGTYPASRVAVLGELRNSCTAAGSAMPIYLPLAWSPQEGSRSVRVLVNSGGADVQLYDIATKAHIPCAPDNLSTARVSFNTKCRVMFGVPEGVAWNGYIQRSREDEVFKEIPVVIDISP
jgi:hypothetical protein